MACRRSETYPSRTSNVALPVAGQVASGFQDIMCRWGAVAEDALDNGTPCVGILDYLVSKYGIQHIRILSYDSRENGVIGLCSADTLQGDARAHLWRCVDIRKHGIYAQPRGDAARARSRSCLAQAD